MNIITSDVPLMLCACEGLPLSDAKRLNYYLHFRPPSIKDEESNMSTINVRKEN